MVHMLDKKNFYYDEASQQIVPHYYESASVFYQNMSEHLSNKISLQWAAQQIAENARKEKEIFLKLMICSTLSP